MTSFNSTAMLLGRLMMAGMPLDCWHGGAGPGTCHHARTLLDISMLGRARMQCGG